MTASEAAGPRVHTRNSQAHDQEVVPCPNSPSTRSWIARSCVFVHSCKTTRSSRCAACLISCPHHCRRRRRRRAARRRGTYPRGGQAQWCARGPRAGAPRQSSAGAGTVDHRQRPARGAADPLRTGQGDPLAARAAPGLGANQAGVGRRVLVDHGAPDHQPRAGHGGHRSARTQRSPGPDDRRGAHRSVAGTCRARRRRRPFPRAATRRAAASRPACPGASHRSAQAGARPGAWSDTRPLRALVVRDGLPARGPRRRAHPPPLGSS